MRTMKVCWMYHDIMDLYGDKGNIFVLKKRCEDRNIKFQLDTCSIGQEMDISQYNLLFIGGGADKEQMSIIPDLLSRKENIQKALSSNTFALLICGGYQLFGQYYMAADGSKIDGLGIYPYYSDTDGPNHRCIGNIVVDADLDGLKTKIIGFENHGGQTFGVDKPLGTVLKGYGNHFNGHTEGFYDGHVLGTYLHGPLLPKNPEFADFIITKAIQKDEPSFTMNDLTPLDYTIDTKARASLLNKWNI